MRENRSRRTVMTTAFVVLGLAVLVCASGAGVVAADDPGEELVPSESEDHAPGDEASADEESDTADGDEADDERGGGDGPRDDSTSDDGAAEGGGNDGSTPDGDDVTAEDTPADLDAVEDETIPEVVEDETTDLVDEAGDEIVDEAGDEIVEYETTEDSSTSAEFDAPEDDDTSDETGSSDEDTAEDAQTAEEADVSDDEDDVSDDVSVPIDEDGDIGDDTSGSGDTDGDVDEDPNDEEGSETDVGEHTDHAVGDQSVSDEDRSTDDTAESSNDSVVEETLEGVSDRENPIVDDEGNTTHGDTSQGAVIDGHEPDDDSIADEILTTVDETTTGEPSRVVDDDPDADQDATDEIVTDQDATDEDADGSVSVAEEAPTVPGEADADEGDVDEDENSGVAVDVEEVEVVEDSEEEVYAVDDTVSGDVVDEGTEGNTTPLTTDQTDTFVDEQIDGVIETADESSAPVTEEAVDDAEDVSLVPDDDIDPTGDAVEQNGENAEERVEPIDDGTQLVNVDVLPAEDDTGLTDEVETTVDATGTNNDAPVPIAADTDLSDVTESADERALQNEGSDLVDDGTIHSIAATVSNDAVDSTGAVDDDTDSVTADLIETTDETTDNLIETTDETTDNLIETTDETSDEIGGTTERLTDRVGEMNAASLETVDRTTETAELTTEAITAELASEPLDDVTEASTGAVETTSHTVFVTTDETTHRTTELTRETVDSTTETADGAASLAGELVAGTVETTSETAERTVDTTVGTERKVSESLGLSIVDQTETVDDFVAPSGDPGHLRGATGTVLERVSETVGTFDDSAGETWTLSDELTPPVDEVSSSETAATRGVDLDVTDDGVTTSITAGSIVDNPAVDRTPATVDDGQIPTHSHAWESSTTTTTAGTEHVDSLSGNGEGKHAFGVTDTEADTIPGGTTDRPVRGDDPRDGSQVSTVEDELQTDEPNDGSVGERSEEFRGASSAPERSSSPDTSDDSVVTGDTVDPLDGSVPSPTGTTAGALGLVGATALVAGRSIASGSNVFVAQSVTTAGLSVQSLVAALRIWLSTLPRFLLFPLYSRYDDDDPFENDNRTVLYEQVDATPGINVSQLIDATDLSRSTARYHLRILEHENLVVTRKFGGKRHLYPIDTVDHEFAACLQDDTSSSILTSLLELEPATGAELAADLGKDPSTLTHHLTRLAERDVIERDRSGRAIRNRLTPSSRAALEPMTSEPSADAAASPSPAD